MNFSGGQSKSITAIRSALAKVISLNNDFSAVLREHEDVLPPPKTKSADVEELNGSPPIGKRRAKKVMEPTHSKRKHNVTLGQSYVHPHKEERNVDCNKTILDVTSITGKVILEQLENEAASLNVDMSVAAKSLVIAQVKLLAGLAKDGVNFDRDLEGIISTTRLLVSRKILNTTDMGEHLLKESSFLSLSLRSLWRFSSTGVVSLEQIIKSIHDRESSESSLLEDLIQLVIEGKNDSSSVLVVSETLAVLIGIAYDLDISQYDSLCKYASGILRSVTEHMLNHILDESENEEKSGKQKTNQNIDSKEADPEGDDVQDTVMNIYHLVRDNLKVTPEAIESYSSSQLLQVLTHHPNVQLGRVLREQERWRFTQANTILSSLFHSLIVVLGYDKTLNTLDLVVTNDEVNWGCVLTLVATVLNCHRNSVAILKGMIEQNIRHGCEDQEMESIVIGLLFARHASQEGRHIFPSYSQWFSALFATEATSPVTDKQSFVFLMRFLTDLVPHEPAYCLRAHLTNQMYTPRGCQEIFRDYCHLARARLKDLKDTLEPDIAIQSVKEKSKVADEVESAITQFAQTSKVPKFVLEASIFRKPYFRSSFLPVLLTPRHIPDVPDARAKLIETLHSTGKLPSSMYNNYIELCQKECAELLTGVFMDVEEDIVIEEPITELSNIFEELISLSKDNHEEENSDAVLPILSRIAQKMEDMMKIYDTRVKDVKHLSIDAKTYNPKLITYQIVEKFVMVVDKVCLTWDKEKISQKRRPVWLCQYLSLLSASATLQSALFTYLLHLSSLGQKDEVSTNKIHIVGIILSELFSIEGLFLPVVGTLAPEQKTENFVKFLIDCLSFTNHQSCIFACSILNSWLDWSLSNSEESSSKIPSLASLPPFVIHLYDCLAPRAALLLAASEGVDVTLAHVYNYLEGHEVPDCSAIYYSKLGGKLHENKVPLEKWLAFELNADWGDVPLDVRLTYLQLRVLRDFVASESGGMVMTDEESSSRQTNTEWSLGDAIVKMVFVLMEIGLKKKNAADVLLLLQSLGQKSQDGTICLLEEWHLHSPEYNANESHVLSFMSICRSLPPPLFLRSNQLLLHSGHLKDLVEQLMVAGQGLQLNLCDTSFLLTALLDAASDHAIKNLQVQQCLLPLRMAIMLHFESLTNIFKYHMKVIRKHSCLEQFWSYLKDREVIDAHDVTPQEAGIRCLALCLRSTGNDHRLITSKVPPQIRTCYLKWLLGYIGQQQVHGELPFFPSSINFLTQIHDKDEKIILACQDEFELLLTTQGTSKLIKEIFPDANEKLLSLQAIPIACVLLVLVIHGESSKKQSNMAKNKEMDLKLIDLLIHCHHVLCKAFESKDETSNTEAGPRRRCLHRKSYSLGKIDDSDSEEEELEYLAELNKKLFIFISSVPSETLSRLSKDSLLKCDSDLKAAISYKLKSK